MPVRTAIQTIFITVLVLLIVSVSPATSTEPNQGEALFKRLLATASQPEAKGYFRDINSAASSADWQKGDPQSFEGNLRIISPFSGAPAQETLYLVRKLTGEIFILALPSEASALEPGSGSAYAGLNDLFKNKLRFNILTMEAKGGYPVAKLTKTPDQLLVDRLFKISIILMLFFVMVGMGMTLTLKDFTLLFKHPKGILVGQVLQFGIMPLLAAGMGYLAGFHQSYPFIFVGMVLITAIPGGVTSNLMTYYAKGDLALSISLTSFSTLLSILFTPMLLALYCANMPEISIPIKVVIQTIMILVVIPLILGMGIRKKWTAFAEKATPFFSALGIIALLVLIGAGIFGNLTLFADTQRYGLKFYTTIFAITMAGMVLGALCSKAFGINNFQSRAISLETGLRNSALAMTIALLIQDGMGDFYSSMFVTSGLFGLIMYLAGIIAIFLFPRLLPVKDAEKEKIYQTD